MARDGSEAISSMGITPLAVLFKDARILFDYFQQLFARSPTHRWTRSAKKLVTSLRVTLGLKPG